MGIHDVTCCGDLWRFGTANVVECQHTLGRSQDCYPAKAGSNEAVNNKRPFLLLLLTQFQALLSRSVCLSLGRIPCVTWLMRKELRYDVTRVLGARNTQKLSKLMIPWMLHIRETVFTLKLPRGSKLFPSNPYNFSLPPPLTLNFTLSCLNSKRIHVVFIPLPTLFFFSASHYSRRADPWPLHLDLNIHHDISF